MVFDLDAYKSHPDKALEKHIGGVAQKALKRQSTTLVNWAALFHDLGKINPNFQRKLDPNYKGGRRGYDEHAYLSAWAWLCFMSKNLELVKAHFGDDIRIKAKIVLTIIAKHHGNLPNFDLLLKSEPTERLRKFISMQSYLPLSEFLEHKLGLKHQPFELLDQDFSRLIAFTEKEAWQANALHYFFETQYSFASLIEADKRDAGDKYVEDYYHFESTVQENQEQLSVSLAQTWARLNEKADKSELDILRTAIREEAVDNLKEHLTQGQRVFTLTAPTGAGKTFTLLALANEIQEQQNGYGIIYALPFLSITEQVEKIVQGFLGEAFLTVSSKAKNKQLDDLIEKLDVDPQDEDFKDLLKQDFISQTFDHPFIITTFVQFFETLLSNRNSTLLKLPNFSKRIFLLDEIQALPPRLYIFFAAWLEAFCKRVDSYAVLSTATMPNMSFEQKSYIPDQKKPDLLFKDYLKNPPQEILDYKKYFEATPFNRYQIFLTSPFEIDLPQLAGLIEHQSSSCLIILNTIRDSKELYRLLREKGIETHLLNTHFIPSDRKKKIELIKEQLAANKFTILISTQLIEAGVDIDFPVVYRDLCPLPSLIQSAGRCNRNKKLPSLGTVYFFHLLKENGKSGAYAVYRNEAKQFLDFSQSNIQNGIEEKDLLGVQENFFKFIANNLMIGNYEIDQEEVNLIELINNAAFETLGKFKLINEKAFGFEFQYYIPLSEKDNSYNLAVELLEKTLASRDFKSKRQWKIQLSQQLKKVLDRTITIRVFDPTNIPAPANEKEYFDIKVLANLDLYNFEEGFIHDSVENSFL